MATAEADTSRGERAVGGSVYDGFISYSHAADGILAPRLQTALQRFAKAWWKRRALRIFRDDASLSANPHLWPSITGALDRSGWFVVLLSPEAAESRWVNNEVEYWLEHKEPERIIPVLTDGEFGWAGDEMGGDASLPALRDAFSDEPRWVDLRFARGEDQLDLARAIELHRSNNDRLALARALTFAVRVNEVNGRPDAADACASESVEILESFPPSEVLAFAVAQKAWLAHMRGGGEHAFENANRAIAIAEQTGAELAMIYALNTKGYRVYIEGDDEGLDLLEEAGRRAQHAGFPAEETRALVNMAAAAMELRRLPLAEELARKTVAMAMRHDLQVFEAYARAQLAEVLAWRGRWTEADDTAN